MEVVVTTGAVRRAKLVKSSPPTNTQLFIGRIDVLPVTQPTVSKTKKKKYYTLWTWLPQAHLGVSSNIRDVSCTGAIQIFILPLPLPLTCL